MRGRKNGTTEDLSCVKYDSSEVLVFSRREVVEPLVDALVVHLKSECYGDCPQSECYYLVALLHKAGQVGLRSDLMDDRIALLRPGGIAGADGHVGKVTATVPGEFLKHEGGHNSGHDTHQEVLHAREPKLFGHSKQPLHILSIAWIPCELCLGSVLAHPPAQGLKGNHAHSIRGHEITLANQAIGIHCWVVARGGWGWWLKGGGRWRRVGKEWDARASSKLVLWRIWQQRCHARQAWQGELKERASCHVEAGPCLGRCGEHLEAGQAVRQAWKLSGNAGAAWSRVCCGDRENVMGRWTNIHVQRQAWVGHARVALDEGVDSRESLNPQSRINSGHVEGSRHGSRHSRALS